MSQIQFGSKQSNKNADAARVLMNTDSLRILREISTRLNMVAARITDGDAPERTLYAHKLVIIKINLIHLLNFFLPVFCSESSRIWQMSVRCNPEIAMIWMTPVFAYDFKRPGSRSSLKPTIKASSKLFSDLPGMYFFI